MELKIDILGWLKRKKAKKLAEEKDRLERSRKIYRGQALKLQGRTEDEKA
jgi:hypothetical protein